jgi:drug/metabolite transporter (DMT)-like permease
VVRVGHLLDLLTVSALIASAIPYTLFAVAQQSVLSSTAGIINATTPLWTLLLAVIAHTGDRCTVRRGAGVALGIRTMERGRRRLPRRHPGLHRAAASYRLAYVYQAQFLTNRGLPPLTLTAIQLLIAAGILALALPLSGPVPTPPALAVTAVLILGTIGTGLAIIINFTPSPTRAPPAASVVTYPVPAVALGLGILVLNEPARLTLPLGAMLILACVALTRSRPRIPRPSP